MPKYKRKRKRFKAVRRRVKRKYVRGKRYKRFTKSLYGKCLTTSKWMTHKYKSQVSKAAGSTSTSLNWHTFRINSIYDIDATGAGHQPYYTDQMYQNYLKAGVSRCKVKLSVTNLDTDVSKRVAVVLYVHEGSTPDLSNFETIVEKGNSPWTVVGPAGTTNETKSLSLDTNVLKKLGKKDLDDDTLNAIDNQDPAEVVYLSIGWACADKSTLTPAMHWDFQSFQRVKWTDPITLAGS